MRPSERFVFAPWHGVSDLPAWRPSPPGNPVEIVGRIDAQYFDGIEPYGDGFLVSAQSDSSIYFLAGGTRRSGGFASQVTRRTSL